MVQQQAQTPAEQQQNAVLNDIAQYVGAKWGRPVVMMLFEDHRSSTFRSLTANNPTEGQFLIAGEELAAMGHRIQALRLDQQFRVSIGPAR